MRESIPHRERLYTPLVEIVAAVGIGVALNLTLSPRDPGFMGVSPHPSLFLTLLILVRYGLGWGALAAGASTVAYAGLLLTLATAPTWAHLLAAPYSTPLVVLVPTTVILGMLVERHRRRLAAAESRRAEVERHLERLQADQARLRDVNVELAGKIVGTEDTLSTLYRYARELNVNDVDGIHRALLRMLKEVIEAEVTSIWTLVDGRLALAAREGEGGGDAPILPANAARYFDAGGVLCLHDVPEKERVATMPYLTGRICDGRGGPVAALLTIERLAFARYNPQTIRLFSMVVDWASASLGNARQFERVTARDAPPPERAPAERAPAPALAAGGEADRGAQRPARPAAPRRAPSELGRLLADAELVLADERRPEEAPAKAGQADAELDRATTGNAPLRALLGEIAGYLSNESRKGP